MSEVAFVAQGVTINIVKYPYIFSVYLVKTVYLVLRWPIGSASVSHQCGPGSIPGWGSDPGAVSEKGLSSLV